MSFVQRIQKHKIVEDSLQGYCNLLNVSSRVELSSICLCCVNALGVVPYQHQYGQTSVCFPILMHLFCDVLRRPYMSTFRVVLLEVVRFDSCCCCSDLILHPARSCCEDKRLRSRGLVAARVKGAIRQALTADKNTKLLQLQTRSNNVPKMLSTPLGSRKNSKTRISPKIVCSTTSMVLTRWSIVRRRDAVILTTPQGFPPMTFEYAAPQSSSISSLKPLGVDIPGLKRLQAANEVAKQKGLLGSVLTTDTISAQRKRPQDSRRRVGRRPDHLGLSSARSAHL